MSEAVSEVKTDREFAAKSLSYAIDIVSVNKRFRRHSNDYTTIKSALLGWFQGKEQARPKYTHAIKDLTLRIPEGSAVGVIGRNGSGKSTLLKLITGIYKADSGQIRVNGRVAALIELGAGFHPDFTGRENVYLAGVMLGLTREEIKDRFGAIVEFAELADVIDDPVRTYSSGMFMRLGFSLAVHTDPNILLIDEVLAVGDAGFVNKCKEKIAQLRRNGKTFLLVTHDLEAVERWCDEALWLHEGAVRDRGDPRRVIDHYRQFIEHGEEQKLFEQAPAPAGTSLDVSPAGADKDGKDAGRWGSREVEIVAARLCDSAGNQRLLFHPEESLILEIDYIVRESVTDVVFGVGITRADGLVVHGSNTEIEHIEVPALGSGGTVRYAVKRLGLLEGSYTFDVAVHKKDGYPYDYQQGVLKFGVRASLRQIGVYVPVHSWQVQPENSVRKVSGV